MPDWSMHTAITGPDHFVPEGWDDLNRGICPRCGLTVVWNPEVEQWLPSDDLVVLVLHREEFQKIRDEGLGFEELEPLLDSMEGLSYDLSVEV